MDANKDVTRRLVALTPLQLVILAIGVRYSLGSGGVPKVIGWVLVAGSLLTLIGYGLTLKRSR